MRMLTGWPVLADMHYTFVYIMSFHMFSHAHTFKYKGCLWHLYPVFVFKIVCFFEHVKGINTYLASYIVIVS